jgi:hypothetical protein
MEQMGKRTTVQWLVWVKDTLEKAEDAPPDEDAARAAWLFDKVRAEALSEAAERIYAYNTQRAELKSPWHAGVLHAFSVVESMIDKEARGGQ